jgi:hypothetical protein
LICFPASAKRPDGLLLCCSGLYCFAAADGREGGERGERLAAGGRRGGWQQERTSGWQQQKDVRELTERKNGVGPDKTVRSNRFVNSAAKAKAASSILFSRSIASRPLLLAPFSLLLLHFNSNCWLLAI